MRVLWQLVICAVLGGFFVTVIKCNSDVSPEEAPHYRAFAGQAAHKLAAEQIRALERVEDPGRWPSASARRYGDDATELALGSTWAGSRASVWAN